MMRKLRSFTRNAQGSVIIETAIVTPVLLLMAIGTFEGVSIVSRQFELQYAVDEAAQVALSAPPHSAAQRETLKNVITASTGLASTQVKVEPKVRCGTETTYSDDESGCTGNYYRFVQITLTDTYNPQWTKIAFGSAVNYNVVRMVMIG